jgi:hypothetical protein
MSLDELWNIFKTNVQETIHKHIPTKSIGNKSRLGLGLFHCRLYHDHSHQLVVMFQLYWQMMGLSYTADLVLCLFGCSCLWLVLGCCHVIYRGVVGVVKLQVCWVWLLVYSSLCDQGWNRHLRKCVGKNIIWRQQITLPLHILSTTIR